MTNAAITPGTQPQMVSNNVIKMDPQPWSITANGGNMIAKITLKTLIRTIFYTLKSYLEGEKFQPFDQSNAIND